LIIGELLPELAKEYKISADPKPGDRWASSAIRAFTVAWERPDARVISTIGSFTNIMEARLVPT
jgi:hypothetical protein